MIFRLIYKDRNKIANHENYCHFFYFHAICVILVTNVIHVNLDSNEKINIKPMRLHVLDVEMCRYLSEVFLDGCFEVVAVFYSLHDFAVLDDECGGDTGHSVGTHDG